MKRTTLYYVLVVHGDVEPELIGPFKNSNLRFLEAIRQRRNDPDKENGIFWLNKYADSVRVGSYTSGEIA